LAVLTLEYDPDLGCLGKVVQLDFDVALDLVRGQVDVPIQGLVDREGELHGTMVWCDKS
jgi:hypothetical protein